MGGKRWAKIIGNLEGHEVVTYVLGTNCYLCLRAGQPILGAG